MRVHRSDPRFHRGAVLVVSLILLMILTLLAVATLRTATLELTIARNAQHVERAFEAAQAGLGIAAERVSAGKIALTTADGWALAAAVRGRFGRAEDEYVVSLRYAGRDRFAGAHRFELQSTGHAHGAVSVQTAGFLVSENDGRPVKLTYWFRGKTQ
jgi:type II secretory pathway pseudopilin PulG